MKNIEVMLSQRRLAHLLEMPRAGIYYPSLQNDFDGLRCILERDDVENFDFHKANQLMVSRIIFSKIGQFDWIAKRELAVMYYLVEGIAMNLPFMILEQIKIAADRSRTKTCLPYGMVFILIFIDNEINLEEEDFRVLAHMDCYTKQSLHYMQYKKVDDHWVCEGDEDQEAQQIEGTPSHSSIEIWYLEFDLQYERSPDMEKPRHKEPEDAASTGLQ